MTVIIFIIAFIIFFIIDILWLGLFAKNMYQSQIGFILAKKPNWYAAIVFYILYIVFLMIFAILPALQTLKENTAIISDIIVLGVTKFLASGIELTVTCQTKPNLQYGVEREIRLFLLEQFKKLNIEIPYDHIVISSKDRL